MSALWYYSRFFGVKKGLIEQDLGDSFVVRVGSTPQIVYKSKIDTTRTDDGGWWSSMDVFADKCVSEAEEWAAKQQAYLDDIETEIAAEAAELRKKRTENLSKAQADLEKARAWRATFKFEELAA